MVINIVVTVLGAGGTRPVGGTVSVKGLSWGLVVSLTVHLKRLSKVLYTC